VNYERHFQLKRKLRLLSLAVVLLAMIGAGFLLALPFLEGVAGYVTALLFGLTVAALVLCGAIARVNVIELERMDREDDTKPWLSRPRFTDDQDCPF
jgi:fatty acid desaturase